jgi:hypothetical protein
MHDAQRVRRRNSIDDWPCVLQQDGQRKASRRHELAQRGSVDELHCQKPSRSRLFNRVNCDDVRMIERGDSLSFAIESRSTFRIVSGGCGENLDGDAPLQL